MLVKQMNDLIYYVTYFSAKFYNEKETGKVEPLKYDKVIQ